MRKFTLIILLLTLNLTFGQDKNDLKEEDLKVVISNGIFLLNESVGGVYSNDWYAYKLDNREIALISVGKSKEIRSFISFNCENDSYLLLASTNFGRNITDQEFKDLVPDLVIDLSRKIQCSNE